MSSLRRVDLIAIGLMFAYVVVVFVRVFYRHQISLRRIGIDADDRSLRKVAVDLRMQVGNLKSIACVAPYLGLVGTCIGIFDAIGGIAMERHAALVRITSGISAAPVTAAAGILVAVSATCVHNYLSIRLSLLEGTIQNGTFTGRNRRFQAARRFPLARRSLGVPAFALIAAPSLAMAIAGYMICPFFLVPKGLSIDLAPARCEFDSDDRLVVLRVTNTGAVFINLEKENWRSLAERLPQIYRGKKDRKLYLLAEEGVEFQKVADAIGIVRSAPVTDTLERPGIRVDLITPASMKARCLAPVVIPSHQDVRR